MKGNPMELFEILLAAIEKAGGMRKALAESAQALRSGKAAVTSEIAEPAIRRQMAQNLVGKRKLEWMRSEMRNYRADPSADYPSPALLKNIVAQGSQYLPMNSLAKMRPNKAGQVPDEVLFQLFKLLGGTQ